MKALLALLILISQAPQIAQSDLAGRIRQAPVFERFAAVQEALEIKRENRSPVLKKAVADELGRVMRIVDKRRRHPELVEDEWDNANIGEYLGDLVQINAESDEAVALQPLVSAIGTGNMAINAVARFGAVAVEPLIKVIADRDADPSTVSGASRALRQLFDNGVLLSAQSRRVSAELSVRLNGPVRVVTVLSIMDLAAVVGSPQLVRRLERIVEDPSSLNLLDPDPAKLVLVQERARRALASSSRK